MGDILRQLGLTFIPLFVAMDSIGNLPILIALTRDMTASQRSGTVRSAMLTALALGLGFVFIGKAILLFLGIEVADFLVAGGIILLVLSVKDLVTGKMIEIKESSTAETVGVVPLGTPLIAGPAVLTTLLLLVEQYLVVIVIVSFVINLVITWLLFRQCNRVVGFLGKSGVTAISKIVSLLLAAIAIKMIRQGVVKLLG
jgi:multiple antibiotic resistance protein